MDSTGATATGPRGDVSPRFFQAGIAITVANQYMYLAEQELFYLLASSKPERELLYFASDLYKKHTHASLKQLNTTILRSFGIEQPKSPTHV